MASPQSPRIVAFAYNCDPDVGSEGGAGWAWSLLLAGIGPTTVLVRDRPGPRASIERGLALLPADGRPDVVFVDLPGWLRPMARRRRSPRIEYLAWMHAARAVARRLHAERPFDLSWHLTWANAWIGTSASQVGVPFVLGPVGAGAGPPWRLVPMLGPVQAASELVRSGLRWLGRHANPFSRQAWEHASLILVQNPETRDWLPGPAGRRAVVMPNALFTDLPERREVRPPSAPPVALFAGRFLAWKGATLGLHAIAQLSGWRLIVCGEGAGEDRLRAAAQHLGIAERVEFRGWCSRAELFRIMREEADVLIFPSLHDEGGWSVAEATQIGLPVVCLDRGGPPVLGGRAVRPGSPAATAARMARELAAAVGTDPGPATWPMGVDGRRVVVRDLLEERGLVGPAGSGFGTGSGSGGG